MYQFDRDIKQPYPGIWNRLEPRPLKKDFSQVLRAEVYDPLWMLNRQWQFGEFKGEDTGSAVFAHVELQHTKLSRYTQGDGTAGVLPYAPTIPLEVRVESETVGFDLKTHLQVSLHFKKLLQRSSTNLPIGLYQAFVAAYRLTPPSPSHAEEAAQQKAQSGALLLWKTAAKRGLLDGERLYADFRNHLIQQLPIGDLIDANHYAPTAAQELALKDVASVLVYWLEATYPAAVSAWQADRLEYRFANAAPNPQGGRPHALVAEEYYHGKVDWYSYDVDAALQSPLTDPTPLPNEDTQAYTEHKTLLPSPVRFAGMPTPRWWEMEDGYINLGNLAQDTIDIPKVLLAQFGLVYNNDWQLVPIRRPLGSLSEVKQIVVTDVFGQKTAVSSANNVQENPNHTWSFFSLSHKDSPALDSRLFLPPVLGKTLESEPIEVVRFARDEMANQVWAIEQYVPSLMGEGLDGPSLGTAIRQHLAQTLADTIAPLLPPTEGLTAYYPLDGHAKGHQPSLDGTLYQTTATANRWGDANAAIGFLGTASSYLTLPPVPALKQSYQLTLSIWVNPSQLTITEQYLVFTKNTQSNDIQAYALSIHNNKFRAYQNAPSAPSTHVDGTTLVQTNTWYHVAVVVRTTRLELYVNGVLEGQVAKSHALNYDPNAPIVLGGTNEANFNRPFYGALDELRVYDQPLTGITVAALYNNGNRFLELSALGLETPLQPADFIYHYLNHEVAEHWTPFMPVRLPNSDELLLQRGKLLRNMPFLPETLQYSKPLGQLLREQTHAPSLYFIKEEEIPRAGVEVKRSFQRTRWGNGQIFLWLGRQKRAGYGEVESQLWFDQLEPYEKA